MMDLSQCRVLAVDDTKLNLDILVNTLGKSHELAVALDGATALEMAAESPPDLILLDIMMPGMNGYEVLERLKRIPPRPRCRSSCSRPCPTWAPRHGVSSSVPWTT